MEDSLKKRYSIKLVASIISGLIGAILIAIVPKELGPVAYGQFIYLQDFFAKIIGFLDMGSSIAFFTKLSANNKRKELIIFYFIYVLVVLMSISLFMWGINLFADISLLIPDIPNTYIYFGLLYGCFIWITQIFMKISDAYALTVSVEFIKILHRVFSLFLLVAFVYLTAFDLEQYFYFHFISLISFLLILLWLFVKKNIFKKLQYRMNRTQFSIIMKEFLEYCSPLVSFSILSISVGLFDIWLLQKMGGSIQMGFYGLAYSIATICFLFTSAMTPIITREFSKAYGMVDIQKMRQLFFQYIPMLYAIAAYFGVFISFQSENLLSIFTDEEFKDAYLVLMIMALYPIHQTYGQLSGSIFYATGQTKRLRNISFLSQPIGVLLSFILIYILDFEAVGLALKMVIGQWVGTNIQLYYNAKFLDFKMKYFIQHQIYTIFFFSILAYLSSHIIGDASPSVSFFFSGVIYTILVIIFAYIFPQIFATNREEIKEHLVKVKNVIKRKIKK